MTALLHIYQSICWRKNFENWWTFGDVIGKMVIVSCAPFALHFCLQRCWSHQISWITCVLRTETVTNCCYVNRQINVILLPTNTKLLKTSFVLLTWHWQTDALSDWPTADHVWHFAETAFLFCGSCVQSIMDFLYGRCKQFFVSELNNAYFSRRLF